MDLIHYVVIVFCALFISTSPAAAAETKELTLQEAITLALENNPDLQAFRLEEEPAKGQHEKARLLLINNPAIEGNISKKDRPEEEEGGGKFTNYGFKLSQEFEVAGQRAARTKASEKELLRVKMEIRDKERILISDVKDAFTRALSLKKKSGLAQEIVNLNKELLGYTKIKFQAGDISGLDVNLSEVELSKTKQGLLLAQREYRVSLFILQGLLGLSPDMSFEVEGELPSEAQLPYKEALKAAAFSNRPDSKASAFEVEKTQFELELAKREAFPNITLSGFYDRDEHRDVAGLEISVPLPFFDRKQAEKKEAFAKAEVAKIKAAGLKKTIEREVDQAFSDITSAIEELLIFKKEILAKAAENLQLLNLAFKEGKIGFFEVRLAQKDTIEAQFAYIEARTRAQLALNALEKITGGEMK